MSAEPLPELAVIGTRLCEPLTGVGRYLECLLRWWSRMDSPFERVRLYAPGAPRLPAEALRRVELVTAPARGSLLAWEHLTLPRRLHGRELLFGAYTLPWFSAQRGVVSNLGIYESRPQDFPWRARAATVPFFRRSVRRARRVIANSTSTKNDVVRYLGAEPDKTEVVLLGADEALAPAEESPASLPAELSQRYGIPAGRYFLFVGKLSKRRNVPLLVEAFAAGQAGGAMRERLVIIGPDNWGLQPLELARKAGVADRVFWAPHAPMADLAHLYRGATALVLPTEHEGFSLTVPEAMASGTPAIVFDHAALEGGVREAALLARPTAEGLADAVAQLARDDSLRRRLRERALACAQQYSWERTARSTMAILARAAGLAS